MPKKLTSAEIKAALVDGGYGHVVDAKKTKYPNTIHLYQMQQGELNVFGCIIDGDHGEIFRTKGHATPVSAMDAVKEQGLDFCGVLQVSP